MVKSLIEQWFPAAAVGAESLRERGSAKAYPPINFLHVWWARRPLIASRAAVLASLLPAWPTSEEAKESERATEVLKLLEAEFPEGEKEYQDWFAKAIGILGDPVRARMAIQIANERGERLVGNGYGYERAFTVHPEAVTLERARRLIEAGSGSATVTVLDPFAGGGAIPFEAARLGFNTIANELNPVAVAILNGTVVLPAELGVSFAEEIKRWGARWADRVQERLLEFFPRSPDEDAIAGYVWAYTVPCPSTGLVTPLLPNSSLARGTYNAAIRLLPQHRDGTIELEVVEGKEAAAAGTVSTYKRGTGQSIWTGETFDGEYIRDMAESGRLSEMLLAVSVSRSGESGRTFRPPSSSDLEAVALAGPFVDSQLARWEIDDLMPIEGIPTGWKTDEPRRMGITEWRDMFTPRQLLVAVTAVEVLRELVQEASTELGAEKSRALNLYLAFALDRALSHNCKFATWDASRNMARSLFVRHDFSMKWTFAEFDGASELIQWAVDNAVLNHKKIAKLLVEKETMFSPERAAVAQVLSGSATSLPLESGSVSAVVTDPPYYDNVMYAELSDFFYVWLKRSLRDTWPELTVQALTDKHEEAVANPSLFRALATGKGRKKVGEKSATDLADERYEDLLTDAFVEAHRVLEPGGVLTVMFTHKRVDAWDTLGQALLQAGFAINSSWPVHTESEHSLHQARMNSASSTIFLTCRKRTSAEPAYWEDLRGEVESAAEEAAHRFSALGIKGVDLTLATYGPALSVLSRNWPVYTGNLDANGEREVIRPDVALDLARSRVALLKKRELLAGRDVDFDRATDWWLLAWNDFQAAEFPAGEALKLCIAMDLELDDVAKRFKLIKAAAGKVTMQTPAQRRTAKALDPEAGVWPTLVDALHALMLIHDEDGMQAAERWLITTGKKDDERFSALVEAAIHAVPRAKDTKGDFARPEARILESLRSTLYDHIDDPDEAVVEEQASLFEL